MRTALLKDPDIQKRIVGVPADQLKDTPDDDIAPDTGVRPPDPDPIPGAAGASSSVVTTPPPTA
ncbi:MAG: hypothetical protein JF615_11050 [Asticcacaulis sp.]|nr:hypothetical protein [Asticcacaulis sp.]